MKELRSAVGGGAAPPQREAWASSSQSGAMVFVDFHVHRFRFVEHTEYICGDCGKSCEIKPKDPIRCQVCGYRIMYKKRTQNCARPRRAPAAGAPAPSAPLSRGRHSPRAQ